MSTAILDQLPDGVASYEAVRHNGFITDFKLVYANALFQELMPADCQLAANEQMLTGDADKTARWQPIADHCKEVVETGQTVNYSLSDSLFPSTNLRISPITDGVLITIRDTPQPAPDGQLQWITNVLNASLGNIFVYEAIRDENGVIQDFYIRFANEKAVQDVKTYMGKEAIGNTLLDIYPQSREMGQFNHCVRVIETGEPFRLEIYYPKPQVWYDTSITKLNDGCIVTGMEITARKRSELRLKEQNELQHRMVFELRQSNENLRQFAQVASHDLQEPLRKIQTFGDILQNQFEDNLADGERDMIRRIQRSAKRMQMLIKDLLAYSQLASQRDPFEPVALNDVIRDVLSDLEIAVSEKNATVQVSHLPTILGSPSRLRQLFQNLIANSLKFKKANQSPVIQFAARLAAANELPATLHNQTTSSFWLISVTDNGLGFEEKYKDRIFHPFQRLHDTSAFSGTGIGLAICQRVAESHGGAIDVSSQPNVGSTFKVFLPVYQDKA
ncbi:PAS domain-containing sensor histidine kinase [Fibrisoma limi]|uniref:PAS domain-containing sensor histidine kinase n=1 Tax=Fibrisoma limi TaxID=663275 RepID=UPI0002F25BFB|nr:ATP-binding protein [Fibrisoma limi]